MDFLFLTCADMPGLMGYDQEVIRMLSEHNISVAVMDWENVVKTQPGEFAVYKAILLRTTWNYYKIPQAFREMLAFVQQHRLPLLNPPDLVRWNMDKRYLLDLEKEGVDIVPTMFVFEHDELAFGKARQRGWQKIVLKPMISASSYHTFVLEAKDESRFNELISTYFQSQPYLLQEFIEEIQNGEVSTLSFANGYMYSITKVPKKGDYRVQFSYGGQYFQTELHPTIQKISHHLRLKFSGNALYQRVDGVWRDGRFLLMELEIIEPDLYLNHNEDALLAWVNQLRQLILK